MTEETGGVSEASCESAEESARAVTKLSCNDDAVETSESEVRLGGGDNNCNVRVGAGWAETDKGGTVDMGTGAACTAKAEAEAVGTAKLWSEKDDVAKAEAAGVAEAKDETAGVDGGRKTGAGAVRAVEAATAAEAAGDKVETVAAAEAEVEIVGARVGNGAAAAAES